MFYYGKIVLCESLIMDLKTGSFSEINNLYILLLIKLINIMIKERDNENQRLRR